MTDDLMERLRDGVPCCDPDAGNGEGSFYVDDANETMCEAADRIEALTAENERLREALAKIADGTMPRPLGEPWRMDMTSSKHDRCVHGAWMYEPCEGCIDAFIASVLGGANG